MGNNKIDEMMKHIVMNEELKEKVRKQTTQEGKVVRLKKYAFGKVALVATLCVAMLGTVTVAAATNKEKIEQIFVDIFNLDEEEQEKLLKEGFVQDFDVIKSLDDVVSVTENGITVSVKQTLADSSSMKILVQVRSENGVELNHDYVGFDSLNVLNGDENIISSFSCEPIQMKESSLYEKYYLVSCECVSETEEALGGTIELVCKDLMEESKPGENEIIGSIKINYDTLEEEVFDENGKLITQEELERIERELGGNGHLATEYNTETGETYEVIVRKTCMVEGEWKLSWNATSNGSFLEIPTRTTIEKDGYEYYIDSIKITPLSYQVIYETDREINPWEDGNNLYMKFVMKNGDVLEYAGGGSGQIGSDGEWWSFYEVMDLNQIERVIVEDLEIPVTDEVLQED